MIYQYNVLKARIDRLDNLISNLEKFNLESNKNTEEIKIKEFTKDNLNTYLKEFSKNIYDSLLAFNELNICINKNKTNDLYERPIRKITNILNERKYIKDRETLIKKAKELISIISDYLEDEFKADEFAIDELGTDKVIEALNELKNTVLMPEVSIEIRKRINNIMRKNR